MSVSSVFRLGVKHTLVLLEQVKVKSKFTAGIGQAPNISLEIKLFDCIKYRVASSGNVLQVRARSALQIPYSEIDINYQRKQGSVDSLRAMFLFGDVVYVKVPAIRVGINLQSRLGRLLKTTLKMKRDFSSHRDSLSEEEPRNSRRTRPRITSDGPRKEPVPVSGLERARREITRILKVSDMGLDMKIRLMNTGLHIRKVI